MAQVSLCEVAGSGSTPKLGVPFVQCVPAGRVRGELVGRRRDVGGEAEDQQRDRIGTCAAGTGCWAECLIQQLSLIQPAFVAHLCARPCTGPGGQR